MTTSEDDKTAALALFKQHLAPILDDQLTKHGVELLLELATTAERDHVSWTPTQLRHAALGYQNEYNIAHGKPTVGAVVCPGCGVDNCEHTGAGDSQTLLADVLEMIVKLRADLKTAGTVDGRPHHDDTTLAARLIELGWRRA